eukprot:CAMPEP_0183716632 /NCGR_PEP_ID=MMETSP0737-20130205/10467_1 /TAXON_ID=385413 /ORGANISM="Thalassiosira miniscula, Strain CCMP1093" /LENGTH=852 /DNA_ID=CAMNT_0025945925 /DNA_START=136 /DNA_END=2696 /DNA_ORIENTATION=-
MDAVVLTNDPAAAELNGSGTAAGATTTIPSPSAKSKGVTFSAPTVTSITEANAMPPPPPRDASVYESRYLTPTPGSILVTHPQPVASVASNASPATSIASSPLGNNATAGASKPAVAVAPMTRHVPELQQPAATRVAAIPSSVAPSTNATTSKNTMALGTPSPLARASPIATAVTAGGAAAAAAATSGQRVLALAKPNGQFAKTATPIIVPSTAAVWATQQSTQRPASALSATKSPSYSVSSAVKAPAHLTSATMGQRVMLKYPATTAQRVVGASSVPATKSVVNGRLGPKASTISTPSPAALQQHRPAVATTVPSSATPAHVSHMPMGAPPPPPPPEPPSSGGSSSKKKGGHPLRRGKWTSEEEAYAGRLIGEFKSGLLPLTDGTTLRNFLSKLLNCDPMRISKKFVGNNCIGKQVFRRRVADINRLTPEQIRQMRVELSELERRFFDRVAQTNRVKSPGVSPAMAAGGMAGLPNTTINIINVGKVREEIEFERPPTPPWLRPPSTYSPKGKFAEKTKAAAPVKEDDAPKSVPTPAPAPAGASQLPKVSVSSTPPLVDVKSDTEKAMEAIQRSSSSLDQLARAASTAASSEEIPRTESALEQLARTASAAKFVEDLVNGDNSIGATQTEDGKKLSQTKLQGSFEALMSMDIQSVENLVELAASSQSSTLLSELSKVSTTSAGGTASVKINEQSSDKLSSRMESFFKSLSSANLLKSGLDSSAALGSLLNAASTSSFEELSKRIESSTGFSQLRAEDGLANGSHNSVDDFLSLVASGDIPHQDPNMLKVPLQKVMQQTGLGSKGNLGGSKSNLKRKLSQQQLFALASRLAGSSSNLSELTCGASALRKRRKK